MKKGFIKKGLSIFLSAVIVLSGLPFMANQTKAASAPVNSAVADAGTAHTFESIMGTAADGNRYAGRVWADKSVYTDGQTAVLNTSGEEGSTFKVNLEEGENFQTVFSVLGSSMTTQKTVSSSGPLDVVLVLDTSTSMDDEDSQGVTRLERTIKAANTLLENLTSVDTTRIAIVTYNYDSETVIPLAKYTNGVKLVVTNYYNDGMVGAGVVTAYDDDNRVLGKDSGYTSGTNLQSGIDRGFNILANATATEGRTPVAIVLTDGQANRANRASWYSNITSGNSASNESLYLSTLLNAAYNKAKIEFNYGTEALVHTVGVDVSTNTTARLLMNPGDASNKGFNATNSSKTVRDTYDYFLDWAKGDDVQIGNSWKFDHKYPNLNGAITDSKIVANINYADKYHDVSGSGLVDAFKQIYEELFSSAFNPITSTETVDGATGAPDTPLIYVDHIGKYMEVKNIQAVTLFGRSYMVEKVNGVYTVEYAKGTNPTTNETYETSDDIKISISDNVDGTKKLEIRINQEILPILLEQVSSETVGNKTTATINELTYDPLRVYYTVGVESNILLPNGEVDLTKIDKEYEGLDLDKGEITLYSNQFGVATAELDHNDKPVKRDAHIGFKPSAENRYYYHQSNQGIFTSITYKLDNKPVVFPNDNEYGIPWNDQIYNLHWMDYADYIATADDDQVYTYVNYYHPTPSTTDNANAAEAVTYLVYTDWKYLKTSVAFYDATTEKYINYNEDTGKYTLDDVGYVMTDKQIEAYLNANPSADIHAVLGVGSMRTSRFHNMTFEKSENLTNTSPLRYAPQYTEGMSADHHGNDVVVWLGNNGKLTLPLNTGIALSKVATEAIGDADDTYVLTLTIDSMPAGETASPVVHDAEGNEVAFTFANNTVKVPVKVGQTVYVSGIPEGSQCTVGEIIPSDADYRIENISSKTVTVPSVEDVMNGTKDQYVVVTVTNTLKKYGNLYITKEMVSDHTIPESIMDEKFAFEVDGGTALANKTFSALDSQNQIASVTFDANGKATVNVSARQRIEILNIPENTVVTLTEKLTTEQEKMFTIVEYRARNHSGETATETTDKATVTIPSTGNATVVTINNYRPIETTANLDVTINKNFADESVKNKLLGGKFKFFVQKYDTSLATPDWVTIAEDEIQYAAEEYGQKQITINKVLANEVYTTTGTYSYQVFEEKGNAVNVSYDRTIYTFDVVVTDNNGQLTATVIDSSGNGVNGTFEADFNNTYETASISMDIKKSVTNLSGDNEVSASGFKFRSIRVDAAGNPLNPNEGETPHNTIYSDAAGEARISGVYTKSQIGTHYYLVYEENTGKAGWSYSKAQYLVTVVVDEDNNGKLVADMLIAPFNDAAKAETAPTVTDNNKGQLYFTNTYDPEDAKVDVDALVKKQLEGKALKAGDFTFEVYENGKSTALLRGTNDENGNIDFKAVDANNTVTSNGLLNFNRVGKYEYDIKEVAPNGGVKDGVTYDTTIYDLVVEVTNDNGVLKAAYYFEDSTTATVTFTNYYNVEPTTYKITGKKVLSGRVMQIGEFSFNLFEGNSTTAKEVASNHANGSFEFSEITYTEAGSYEYTITEGIPAGATLDPATNKYVLNGVTYDATEYTVTVTVTDNQDGTLTAKADVDNINIIFTNSYNAAPTSVIFNGTKEFKGATLNAGDFAFNLYQTDHNLNTNHADSVLKDTKTNALDGGFSFDAITFTEPGTYFYVIDEDDTYNTKDEVVYDTAQHGYRVQVRDHGRGQLVATVMNMDTGAIEADNANITFTFTNATFDEATEKEVARQENAVAKIDGDFVEAGEILTYYIYYYNYTGKEAIVGISDTIPAYTSYVEGSASHGGVYSGGNIDWILTIPRGGSVMVQFDVKVDESDVIVANTAIVRDGTNTYTTNTVNNHTYKEPVSKDVVRPEDVNVSIDGKKVYEGDTLVYFIDYTNTSYDTVDVTITDEIPEYTTYVEGSAVSGGVYDNGTITWKIEDVRPWSTVSVAFMVTVDENIGTKTITNMANIVAGNKPYTTNEVTNYIVEDEVEKKVFSADDPTVSIDGQEVKAGDTLVYTISYKNNYTEDAIVTITDTLSEYTTYVEGSADNNGVYANGVVTWELTVPAGETIVVSFEAVVNDNAEGEEISNTAQVVEGRNEYTTNEVINSVEEVPTPPEGSDDPEDTEDPTEPENPEEDYQGTPDSPKTGDYTNYTMLLALVFISGGIVTITSVLGKKNKSTK